MTTTITPKQADTLPAEAIEAAAEALYTADYRNGEPFAKYPVGSYWGDRYRSEAHAALLAALPHLARRAAIPSEQGGAVATGEDWRTWCEEWHAAVESAALMLGLRVGLGASEFVEAVRSYAHPAPAAGVRVKALEWVRSSWARPNNDGTLSRAESVFGTYRVWTNPETGKWFWRLSDAPLGREPSGTADNEPASKAAAQADYEARIRSALG